MRGVPAPRAFRPSGILALSGDSPPQATCAGRATDYIIFPAMPANTQKNRKIVQLLTSGTIFVYIAIPIQRTKGAMLKGKSAHVPDLPHEEAVADPEKTQRLWDAIQAQDTPPGTRLKLLKMMPGGENAKEEVFRLIQEGIVAENDALQRLASEPVAGNA